MAKTTKTKKATNKKNKSMGKIYHKKTEIDGIVFDSQTEAEYYQYLKQLQNDGHIVNFRCHLHLFTICILFFCGITIY